MEYETRAPYKHDFDQTIDTDAPLRNEDQAFIAHVYIPAAVAVAADADGIMPATNLDVAKSIIAGLTQPTWPRNVQIDGNVSGITGNVKVYGTNFADAAITETLAANGTTAVAGSLAFKSITKVDLPAKVHTAVKQVETATAAGTVTTAGNALVTVTSALLDEAEAVDVPVALNDDAAAIALAIRTALAANANIAAHFTVSGADAAVILTAKLEAANDTTLNIAIDDGTGEGASEGVTAAASSADTTAGVPHDQISLGWEDKFGIPYMLDADERVILKLFNKAVESTEGTVTVDADELEKNVYEPNAAADGAKDIDLYIIV